MPYQLKKVTQIAQVLKILDLSWAKTENVVGDISNESNFYSEGNFSVYDT